MPPIPALHVFTVLTAVLIVSGCDAGKQVATPTKAAATARTLTNGMEFSGECVCVDCDGIKSWLRLEQAGKTRRYRMVEVYYGQDRERRFEEMGAWSTAGELLRLRSSQGGERVYARNQDGYLLSRGAHGQLIPAIEGDVLKPARFDSAR